MHAGIPYAEELLKAEAKMPPGAQENWTRQMAYGVKGTHVLEGARETVAWREFQYKEPG